MGNSINLNVTGLQRAGSTATRRSSTDTMWPRRTRRAAHEDNVNRGAEEMMRLFGSEPRDLLELGAVSRWPCQSAGEKVLLTAGRSLETAKEDVDTGSRLEMGLSRSEPTWMPACRVPTCERQSLELASISFCWPFHRERLPCDECRELRCGVTWSVQCQAACREGEESCITGMEASIRGWFFWV